jgi:recombination protein RecA
MRKITNMIGRQKVLIVFTNQLRQNLKAVPFGDQFVVSGGKALAYHCSVRVRLTNSGKLEIDKEVIGNKCIARVIKNRMGPPQRKAEFDIYFDSGIADYSSWIKVLKEQAVIKPAGSAGLKYIAKDGTEHVFQTKEFVKLVNENPALKEEMYNIICEEYIMRYKDPNSTIIEDVEVTSDDGGTEESQTEE